MSDWDRVRAVAHEVLASGTALPASLLIAAAFGDGLRPPAEAITELARHLARTPGLLRLPDGRLCSVAAVLADRRLTVDPECGALPLWPDLPHLRLRFPEAVRVGVRHPGGPLLAPLTDQALVVGRAALRELQGAVVVRCRRAGIALESSTTMDMGERWPAALRAAVVEAVRRGSQPALADVLLTALADDLELARDMPVPPLGVTCRRAGLVLDPGTGTVMPPRTSGATDRRRTRTARPRPLTAAARRASAPRGTPRGGPGGSTPPATW